nr:RecName: Full=Putative antimicrobial peptide 1; Short=Ls-AMP1 [Lippia origanoides]
EALYNSEDLYEETSDSDD